MCGTLKSLHVAAVVLSGTGFVARYAYSLAWIARIRPFADPWLEAKLAGLVVYILAGTVALKRGRTPGGRAAAFVVALLAYAYIVSVALTKNPLGLLAGGP